MTTKSTHLSLARKVPLLASKRELFKLFFPTIGILTVVTLLFMSGAGFWVDFLIVATAVLGVILACVAPTGAIILGASIGLTAGFTRRILEYFIPDGVLISTVVLIPGLIVLSILLFQNRPKIKPIKTPGFWMLLVGTLVLAGVNPFGSGIGVNLLTSALLILSVSGFILSKNRLIEYRHVVTSVLYLGAVNALYMIFQHEYGITPWDQYWVDTDGYAALYVGPGEIRPLGLASSAAESSAWSGITLVLAASGLRYRKGLMRLSMLPIIPIALTALLYSGTRTFLILSLIAICAFAVNGSKRPVLRFIAVLVIAIPLVMQLAASVDTSSSGAARSLTTLSGEEDLENSTIPIHWELLTEGISRGLASVIGTGSGQLSVLSSVSGNTEVDISNLAVMSGFIGLVAAIWMYKAFGQRLKAILRAGGIDVQSGLVLVALLGQWLAVGYYGLILVAWLAFGDLYKRTSGGEVRALADHRQR